MAASWTTVTKFGGTQPKKLDSTPNNSVLQISVITPPASQTLCLTADGLMSQPHVAMEPLRLTKSVTIQHPAVSTANLLLAPNAPQATMTNAARVNANCFHPPQHACMDLVEVDFAIGVDVNGLLAQTTTATLSNAPTTSNLLRSMAALHIVPPTMRRVSS
jgi:hypothetical protein